MTNRFLRSIYFILAILSGAGTSAVWAQNELFVTDQGNNSVTVYPRTANGNVAPLRTLAGAATGLNGPLGLAVDTVNNEQIVTNNNNNSVTVYLLTANGNVAPLRTLVGAATGLNFPTGLAVDTVNNELIVANSNNSITVYGRTANGNVGPLRTLVGAATGLNGSQGVAVDTVNNELIVANSNNSITVYTRTANGNVAPTRTLTGAATGLSTPQGPVVDTVNNELVVANGASVPYTVTVHARTANGNVAPTRTLVGAATGLSIPVGLAVDTVNNEMAVANFGNNSVTVYARTVNGNTAPLRTLAGAATLLNIPTFVAITASGAPPPPTINTISPLPVGTVGTAYAQTFTASGGTPPYTAWTVIAGTLPGGLMLNGSTGALTGTPTNAGTFNFTVQVTDSAAVTATASFSLTVNAVVAAPTQPIPTLSEWGVLVLFALLAVGAVIRLRRR